MALNREQLLAKLQLKSEVVELDGGSVIVSEIGAVDYMRLWTDPANHTDGQADMLKITPALIAYSVVDEDGNRIFSDEDVALLSKSAQGPFLQIAAVAKKLNGIGGDETVKNSVETDSDASASGSVSSSVTATPANSSKSSRHKK